MSNTIYSFKYNEIQLNEKRFVLHKGRALNLSDIHNEAIKAIETSLNEHLLIPIIETDGQSVSIQYRLEKLASINKHLETSGLTLQSFYQLLHRIALSIKRSITLGISSDQLIISSSSFIWTDGKFEHLKLLYIPVYELEKSSTLAQDLINLTNELYAFVSNKNTPAYEALLEILNNNPFTLEAFIDLLAICIGNPNKFSNNRPVITSFQSQVKEVIAQNELNKAPDKNGNSKKNKSVMHYITLLTGLILLAISITTTIYEYEKYIPLDPQYITMGSAMFGVILIFISFGSSNKSHTANEILDVPTNESQDDANSVPNINPSHMNEEPKHNIYIDNIEAFKRVENPVDETILLGGNMIPPINKTACLMIDDEETFTLDYPITIIGRSESHSNLVIDLLGVSRAHCKILKEHENFYIEDLNSKNKTIVNNKYIPANERIKLHDGDVIKIVSKTLQFKVRDFE